MAAQTRAEFRRRPRLPEAHSNARRIGRQTQHMAARSFLIAGKVAAVEGTVERVERPRAAVGVVLRRLTEEVGHQGFKVARLLGPKHRGGIADLNPLTRVAPEQVIKRRGVGEGGGLADGRVRTLPLAVGIEGVEIEGNDVGARGLRAPHALDYCM